MVFAQEGKSESMITIIRTEVTMDEDATESPTERLDRGGHEKAEGNAGDDAGEEKETFLAVPVVVVADVGKKGKSAGCDDGAETPFDAIMEDVGTDGKFQRRFDAIYNFVLVLFVAMPYLNIILAMTVPEHWCHVPGRHLTNLTLEEWKAEHLPMDPNKIGGYSSCKMYETDEITRNRSIVDCKYGWDFDREWYTETAPSLQGWVCDREVYVSNAFAAGRIGEIVGTFVFGQLGDQFGRRPVFYISMVILLFGRIISAFTSDAYYVFVIMIGVGSTASISVFQSPLVISMEVSDPEKRSYITFLQCVGWVAGLCVLSLLAWLLKEWKLIMVVSSLPCFAYFFMYKLLPESPRWLANKGRAKEAAKVLKYMARVNGRKYPENADELLQKISDKKEKFYGIPTLFLHWRLAKNTLIIIFCWGISGLCYYILVLNVTTMSGNPFLNFFWQSLVELPGYVFGKYFSNVIGRRWTQTGAYMFASCFCIIAIFIRDLHAAYLEILFVSLVKLCLSTSFYMVWLQAIEIYPTCVRQTGTSVGGMVSNTIGIFGPYIVLLGSTVHPSIPYSVILCSAVLAGICAAFLPETYSQKLPETLEDAQNFGKDQKFWDFKIYRKKK